MSPVAIVVVTAAIIVIAFVVVLLLWEPAPGVPQDGLRRPLLPVEAELWLARISAGRPAALYVLGAAPRLMAVLGADLAPPAAAHVAAHVPTLVHGEIGTLDSLLLLPLRGVTGQLRGCVAVPQPYDAGPHERFWLMLLGERLEPSPLARRTAAWGPLPR